MKTVKIFFLIVLLFFACKKNFTGDCPPVSENHCGLFLILQGGMYGYMNKSGKVTIEPRYEKAFDFSEGLAMFVEGAQWGVIDTAGNVVIEPAYTVADYFSEGMAAIKTKRI